MALRISHALDRLPPGGGLLHYISPCTHRLVPTPLYPPAHPPPAHRSDVVKRRRRAALVNTWQSFLVGEICKLSDANHIGLTKWRTADGQQVWGRVRIRQVTLDHQDAVATLAIDSGGRACYTCRYPGGYPNQTLTPAPLGLNASARPLAPTLDPNPPTLTLTLYRLKRGELLDYDKAQQPALKRKDNDRAQYAAWVAAKAAHAAAPSTSDRSGLKRAVKRAHAGLEDAGLAKRLCVRGAKPPPWWRMEEVGLFSINEQLGKCVPAHHLANAHLANAHLAAPTLTYS